MASIEDRRFRTLTLVTAAVWLLMGVHASARQPAAQIIGGDTSYVVRVGDTLAAIAARFGVAAAQLIELNELRRPNHLVVGDTLAIRNPHLAIVEEGAVMTINVAQRMLFLVDDDRITGYPVTVGRREWPTPLGRFTIIEKETDPAWDVPLSIQREMAQQGKPVIRRVAPSPDNPLGTRWLRLSLPGLGIHGTNLPASIYRYGSHGCIRLHPDHIIELFERVAVGASGVLVYRPVMIAVIDGQVWLEAHPDPYGHEPDAMPRLRQFAEERGLSNSIDWSAVGAALRRRDGLAENVTRPSRVQ